MIPYCRHYEHVASDPRNPVDDHPEPLASPPRCGGRLQLRQLGRVLVDDVRYEVPKCGNHHPVNSHKPPLVLDQHLDSVRQFGDPAVGYLKVKLVSSADARCINTLLDVPVRQQHDRGGAAVAREFHAARDA